MTPHIVPGAMRKAYNARKSAREGYSRSSSISTGSTNSG
jgi:hypothetical protein